MSGGGINQLLDENDLAKHTMGFNTISLLRELGMLTQGVDDAIRNMLGFLKKCGFSDTPPERLFRYRPPKYMVDEIEKHYIHFSSATTMSDPYDCMISSIRILKKCGIWDEDFFDDDRWAKEVGSFLNELVRDRITICSFSSNCKSFSMWDQYAKGHRGICIEYDTEKLKLVPLTPMKVRYRTKTFKRFDKGANDLSEYILGHIGGCILTKNCDYRHEQEWRVFGSGLPNVDITDAIRCVYIGSKCSEGRNKVIHACKQRGIDVIQLKVKEDDYSFTERKIQ